MVVVGLESLAILLIFSALRKLANECSLLLVNAAIHEHEVQHLLRHVRLRGDEPARACTFDHCDGESKSRNSPILLNRKGEVVQK